jgi:hypothetical protein
MSVPQWWWVAVGALLLIGVFVSVVAARQRARDDDTDDDEPLVERLEDNPDNLVTLPEPDLRTASFGIVGQFFKFWKYRRKQRKLARKGYVKWILINGVYPRPMYIRPEQKGGGDTPEYEYKGETYLFPRDAALPDARSGMWTVTHKKGESEPLNLRDPSKNAISAKALDEYLGMRVSSSPPGLLDKLGLKNIGPEEAIMYSIAAVILLSVVGQYL